MNWKVNVYDKKVRMNRVKKFRENKILVHKPHRSY